MNPIWIVGNAITVVSALICSSYLRYERKGPASGWPWVSIAIIGIAAVFSGLQFPFPELVTLFQRDSEALRSGEVWRLVTPMLVQPGGLGHCLLNGFLAVMFLPVADRLYGKGLLTIYFVTGLVGQAFHYWWETALLGGSSTAIFGTIGSIFIYILRNRKYSLTPFVVFSAIAVGAGVMLAAARDGHGAGLLMGVVLGGLLPAADWRSRVPTSSAPVAQ